jgi:hypothetical protein
VNLKSAITMVTVIVGGANSALAADVDLTKGRLAHDGSYAVQTLGATNKSNYPIKMLWVDCGFFHKGSLLTSGKGYVENVLPNQTAYFDVQADNSQDADSTDCRVSSTD